MSFVPPRFAVGVDTSIGGVSSRRRFGNRQYDARLNVEFRNIPNSVYAQMLIVHKDSKGLAPVSFLDSFFRGAGAPLQGFLDGSQYAGLAWYFIEDSPPRGDRVEGGLELCNVSIEFIGRVSAA